MTGGAQASRDAGLTPELRDRLVYYGGRAPSPHNAQGWRIEADGPRFRVSRDLDHQVLSELDPAGRESDLACGAVVTNLCVGARAFGFDAEVRWRPDGDAAADVVLRPASAPPDEAPVEVGLSYPGPRTRRCPPTGTPASRRCAANCWRRSVPHRRPLRSPCSGWGRRPASRSGAACVARPASSSPRPLTTGR